jgi:hypothetical protein
MIPKPKKRLGFFRYTRVVKMVAIMRSPSAHRAGTGRDSPRVIVRRIVWSCQFRHTQTLERTPAMTRTLMIAFAALVSTTAAGFANGYDSGRDIAERGAISPQVFGTLINVAANDLLDPSDRRLSGATVQVSTKASMLKTPGYGNDRR